MQRRGFLAAVLAAGVAPKFVPPTSLMSLWVPAERKVLTKINYDICPVLRVIANGLGISYEQAWGAYESSPNYSAAREHMRVLVKLRSPLGA